MLCPRCGHQAEHKPGRATPMDVTSAKHSGSQAAAAIQSGHPLTAVAHVGYQAAKVAFKAYQSSVPWKCPNCGNRF
jgi:predicted RNA-binding Zn-ribbon protein involved in translation (DUF1610 family)